MKVSLRGSDSLVPLRGLRALCSQLNDAQISPQGLNSLVESLGRSSGSKGVLFIRERYPKNKAFSFEFMAGWKEKGGL